MDISLAALEINTKTLYWAGANNPLWIIRRIADVVPNANTEFAVMEFKPDKQPVGMYANTKPFTTHKAELQSGDTIYLFTDGFRDQFGGTQEAGGKKFKTSRFKELLLSIQHLSMDDQKQKLDEAFEEWKGDLEQVDDVCVLGIRIG